MQLGCYCKSDTIDETGRRGCAAGISSSVPEKNEGSILCEAWLCRVVRNLRDKKPQLALLKIYRLRGTVS
jgi:hypothetical protein